MAPWVERILTILVAVLATSGFWEYLRTRREKKDAKTRMILGLGHDKIVYLCMKYIERGWISQDEHEDLNKYIYEPYKAMGGNGTAKRLMEEVNKLPIHKITYMQQAKNSKNGVV